MASSSVTCPQTPWVHWALPVTVPSLRSQGAHPSPAASLPGPVFLFFTWGQNLTYSVYLLAGISLAMNRVQGIPDMGAGPGSLCTLKYFAVLLASSGSPPHTHL